MLKLGIPQIIYLGMLFTALGIGIAEHGKPKTGKNSAWISLLAFIIEFTLLYYGGFFK